MGHGPWVMGQGSGIRGRGQVAQAGSSMKGLGWILGKFGIYSFVGRRTCENKLRHLLH